mgnify:CR=1 FL=1
MAFGTNLVVSFHIYHLQRRPNPSNNLIKAPLIAPTLLPTNLRLSTMPTGSLVLLMYTNLRKVNEGFFKKENGENECKKDEDEWDITAPGAC